MPDTPQHTRPDFTLPQLRAARQGGHITPLQREIRRRIATHPIDNVPPETPADRDDGIYVEASQHGSGYRVHVTIADVAGHISPDNPLFHCTWKRAFTTYRPWRNDPMFPKPLEHRMSLEHGQERLGMTITFDLDAQYRVTDRRFGPTLTIPDSSSYHMASTRMQSEPQFQLMAKIAEGIRADLGEETLDALVEAKARMLNLSNSEKYAMRVNETFMILANIEMANFFHASGLPFVYRNFNPEGSIGRAYYSTTSAGHADMRRGGWEGHYSHITSPIRRGPDVLNQYMQHYVHGLVTGLHENLSRYVPATERDTLHSILWREAPHWIHASRTPPHRDADGTLHPQHTAALLTDYVHAAGGRLPAEDAEAYASFLSKERPPLQRSDINHYVTSINRLNDIEHEAILALQRDERAELRLQQRRERLTTLNGSATEADTARFSEYLRDAAVTGLLPDSLHSEALRRIREGKCSLTQDGLSIMVIANYPADPAWLSLKRSMARAIKHDPSAVNGILELARNGDFLPGELTIAEASLPLTASPAPRGDHIESAIVALSEPEGRQVAPPYYSIGHNARAARSHAQYSFLEYYAFGQLRPLEQSTIPHMLYADLDNSDQPRRTLVEGIAEQLGAHLSLEHTQDETGTPLIHLRVAGGKLPEPIRLSVAGKPDATPASLEASALRRLLRDPLFQDSSRSLDELGLREWLRPHEHLRSMAEERGGSLELTLESSHRRGSTQNFTMKARLLLPGEHALEHTSAGPNKDRASNAACTWLLRQKGWLSSPELPAAKSWISRNRPRPEPEGLAR